MNSLDLMQARLRARGGVTQQDRMIKDKRETLDRVVWYSYQGADVRKLDSETVERALINPNTVKQDYDDKIISIGYEYDYKPGTIFDWVNTGTKWLIYLQDLTELAYFKGDIRKCNYQINWKNEKNDICSTYAAITGPSESNIKTTSKDSASLDLPNHSLKLMLPATKAVVEYFKRYAKFYIHPLKEGDSPVCWRVEATDTISMPGILELIAYEYYMNEQKDNVEEGIVDAWGEEIPEPQDDMIRGNIFIKPKRSYTYKYLGAEEASWFVNDSRLPIEINQNGKEVTIIWTTTYTGQFVLQYGKTQDTTIVEKTIVVESLF